MRAILKSLPFAGITVLAWGSYGPTIHEGEAGLGSSKWAALLCVGLAYFVIAVIIPLVWLKTKGENGQWTKGGFVWGLGAGTCGALGALGIITAISSGGSPSYVMPIVFGGAPVVNTLVSMWMGKLFGQATNGFYLGIILVALGTVGVFLNRPEKADSDSAKAAVVAEEATSEDKTLAGEIKEKASAIGMVIGGICLTVLCWGSYGSVLHKSQAKMAGSRLRPLFCVGLAYFLIAVLVPIFIIYSSDTAIAWTASGITWSVVAGSCGAIGALGIILSFTFGGRPAFVMPIVFGGAPVINTLIYVATHNTVPISTMFIVSLTVVILGAITTLVCAPKPGKPSAPPVEPEGDEDDVSDDIQVAESLDADTTEGSDVADEHSISSEEIADDEDELDNEDDSTTGDSDSEEAEEYSLATDDADSESDDLESNEVDDSESTEASEETPDSDSDTEADGDTDSDSNDD